MRFFFGTSMAAGAGGLRKLAGECGSSRVTRVSARKTRMLRAKASSVAGQPGPVKQPPTRDLVFVCY